jgi:hypothetical protein
MFRHPYADMLNSRNAHTGPFGTVLPVGPPPGWPPAGLPQGQSQTSNAGENARKVVDTLTGTPQPLTLEDAFAVVFSKLQEFPGNDALIGQAEGFRQAITERLTQQRQARRAGLEAELEALRVECRQKLDRVRSLRVEMNSWDSRISAFGEQTSRTRAEANAVRADEPRREDYPTAGEVAAWRERVRAAEVVLGEAEGREHWAENERQAVINELQQAISQFQVAEQAEAVLAARLEGRPYPGPYGITHPPEAL